MTQNDDYTYIYDKKGKLIKIYENKKLSCSYYYDEHDRIIREDNVLLNLTITYEYDKFNQLIKRQVYDLTKNIELSIPKDFDIITYSKNNTKQITNYNDEHFKYSKNGLPAIYRDANLTWSKNKDLLSIDSLAQFKYKNHLRISKQIGRKQTKFCYTNNHLVLQIAKEIIKFNYNNDIMVGFDLITNLKVKHFTYVKNVNNDIIGIVNEKGILICKYVYDIFGNHNILIKSNNDFINISLSNRYVNKFNLYIANLNPIRFHGYYYDIETGLYSTDGNYYDSQIGKFI